MSINKNNSKSTLLFDKTNYIILIVGLIVLSIGFMMLSGGKSPDPNVFDKEAVYSFRRITLAPLTIVLGFVIEIWAIMRVPKTNN